MRIADKMNYEQVKSNLAKNRTDLAELQNQAATQKRVTKPSDDPLAATRVLAARTEISGTSQFLKSVGQARTFLEYSDQSLSELTDLLNRAKELALSQANDPSAGPSTREVTAAEIEQLHKQAVQVGNRKLGDRFLFAGFKTTRAPFDANGNYKGDDGEIRISINKETRLAMNMPGSFIFLGHAAHGPASPTVSPSNENIVPLGQDSQAPADAGPGSGSIQNPTDSNDPVIRGPASEDQASDAGEANFSATWKTGVNIFHVLQRLETGLRANDKETVQESLDRLDQALAQVVLARAQLGARVSSLNSTTDTLQKGQVDAKGLVSNLEDVDTFELVSDLNKTESTLKASLETSGKLIQPSLLDFLR